MLNFCRSVGRFVVSSNMDHTEDTHTEDLDTETQMDATSGRESPVIAQTQKTIDRESQRTKSRRKRGGAEKRGRNPSSSKSVSPERPRGRADRSWRVSAATNTTSSTSRSRSPPPETPVTDRERGRAGRNAATDAATNAINAARENRARFSSGNLDPRVKSRVDPELLHDLKSKVKKLYRQLGLTLSHQVQLQREAVKKQCPHLYGFSPLL